MISVDEAKAMVRDYFIKNSLELSRESDTHVPTLYAMLDDRTIAEKVIAARTESNINRRRKAWDCCILELDMCLLRKKPIPPELGELLLDLMNGKIKKPHDKKGTMGFEHRQWAKAVMLLVQNGFHATRNDASDMLSACDIVADVVCENFSYGATYNSVKKSYHNFKKLNPRLFP